MRSSKLLLIGIVVFFLKLEMGQAFPDTIRHGYANCTTCHVSPGGGGLLNGYGRSLSKELISTWGKQGEEQPMHGLAKIPEGTLDKFLIGGDARYLSRRTQGKSVDVDEGFLMQAQLRFGLVLDKIKFVMTIGKIENPRVKSDVRYVSPEYFALWAPKEELYVRVGRFEPVFGLRLPDHNVWARSDAGFLPWIERDTVEFISEGETQFASVAGFQATSAMNVAQQITGYAASVYQVFSDRYRVGLSMMNAEGQGHRSRSYSVNGTLGFTEKFYTMTEVLRSSNNGADKDIGFLRMGYEITKGFVPLLQLQGRNSKGAANASESKSGVGFFWYPRPHFEIMSLVENVQTTKDKSIEYTLLFHYYL